LTQKTGDDSLVVACEFCVKASRPGRSLALARKVLTDLSKTKKPPEATSFASPIACHKDTPSAAQRKYTRQKGYLAMGGKEKMRNKLQHDS
jgi:hypothetical protein